MGTALVGEALEGVVDIQGPKSYERMEGEPVDWYARFQHFLLQGRGRTVQGVYRAEAAQGNLRGQRGPGRVTVGQEIHVPGSWKEAVSRWDWYARAAAYDIEQLEADKRQVEADRAERRRVLLDQEWEHGQQMVETTSEALKQGPKFFERTTRLQPGKFVETEEIDPKTGRTVRVRTRVDREIVYIELKAGDLTRMLMEGGKKARMAVGMTSQQAQEEFADRQGKEHLDVEAIDQELFDYFEMFGANSYRPPTLPQAPDDFDLPEGQGDTRPDGE